MKMRILQVTPYFAPAWAYGGPPRVMYEYARGLARRGHLVDVFTTDVLDATRRAEPSVEIITGICVHRFPNVSNTLAWRTKKYQPRGLVRALARRVRTYDVVHVTDTRTALTASAYLACRTRGVPLCLSAHGSLPGSAGVRGQIKRAYDRLLVRPSLQGAALLLAQTEHEALLYRVAGGRDETIRMLPLPVEADLGDVRLPRGLLRDRVGLSDDEKVVLFLGRIHRLKGLDLLIAAIEPLLSGQEAVLVVAGRDDGQWRQIARRFARLIEEGRIRAAGPLYGADRFAAYADADVFCLTPRHWEETSLASLEAAACGTPIVVTEQADVPHLTESGGGFVVPLQPEAIRGAIVEVLERKEEMGPRARDLMRQQHAPDVVVGLLERYLLEVASARASA
jgi:glycosyltransferase involved in cell wall biosynthesis